MGKLPPLQKTTLTSSLEATWVVGPGLYQQSLGLSIKASGALSRQSPKGEPRALLLTRSQGWEASGRLRYVANPHAPAVLEAGLKHSRRRDAQQAVEAWTTMYRPEQAHVSVWTVSLTTQNSILPDAQVGMQHV